jgi:hypothetical protein
LVLERWKKSGAGNLTRKSSTLLIGNAQYLSVPATGAGEALSGLWFMFCFSAFAFDMWRWALGG